MFESEKDYAENIDNLISHLNYEKLRSSFLKGIVKKYNCESAIKDEIKEYVGDIEKSSLVNAKQFTYNNSIISLYGFFENFLENIVNEFIASLNTINAPFGLLPKEIKSLHLNSSIELLKKIQRDRSKNKEQKSSLIKSVVFNMNSCVHEEERYQLNENAFSIHTSNFRYDSVHNLFCKIGIQSMPKKALRNTDLKNSIVQKHTIDSDVNQRILVSLLMSELDDLAQRRNEIAHGSFDGELESTEIVTEKALLLKSFGAAIGQILTDYFFNFVFLSSTKVNLGLPTKTFNGINVFGFSGEPNGSKEMESEISVGDMLFAYNNNSDELKYGKVISMVLDNKDTEKIKIPSSTDFAIKVDFDLTSHIGNREIYTVSQA